MYLYLFVNFSWAKKRVGKLSVRCSHCDCFYCTSVQGVQELFFKPRKRSKIGIHTLEFNVIHTLEFNIIHTLEIVFSDFQMNFQFNKPRSRKNFMETLQSVQVQPLGTQLSVSILQNVYFLKIYFNPSPPKITTSSGSITQNIIVCLIADPRPTFPSPAPPRSAAANPTSLGPYAAMSHGAQAGAPHDLCFTYWRPCGFGYAIGLTWPCSRVQGSLIEILSNTK